MLTRHAWQGAWVVITIVLSGHSSAVLANQESCVHSSTVPHRVQLSKEIASYSYADFLDLVDDAGTWREDRGADNAPRRPDCGHDCIYKPANADRNERNDEPPKVLASIHPVCDAADIQLATLPEFGVIIGRVRYEGTYGPLPPGALKRLGDAAFNIGDGKFKGRDQRAPEHYVLLSKGPFLKPESHAIWRLVALFPPKGQSDGFVKVVDQGLFRFCLEHDDVDQEVNEPLASFRSCAEVEEFRIMSLRRPVQWTVLADSTVDSTIAQRETYLRLVRGDTIALNRLRSQMSVLFPGLPPVPLRDDDAIEPRSRGGPFSRTMNESRARLPYAAPPRYGELHVDAPMWFVCSGGCCSGEPW